jgi:hypothetical protein
MALPTRHGDQAHRQDRDGAGEVQKKRKGLVAMALLAGAVGSALARERQ